MNGSTTTSLNSVEVPVWSSNHSQTEWFYHNRFELCWGSSVILQPPSTRRVWRSERRSRIFQSHKPPRLFRFGQDLTRRIALFSLSLTNLLKAIRGLQHILIKKKTSSNPCVKEKDSRWPCLKRVWGYI